MTRRDRVAIVAALEQLRFWRTHLVSSEDKRVEYAETGVKQAAEALDDIGTETLWDITQALTNRRGDRLVAPARLLRARLALLLRALLRSDAGDFGPVECSECGHGGYHLPSGEALVGSRCHVCELEAWQVTGEICAGPRHERRRYRPLWEQAPSHAPAHPGTSR